MEILIFIVLILFTFYYLTAKETFQSTCNCGRCYSRSECPTRNMSYDL